MKIVRFFLTSAVFFAVLCCNPANGALGGENTPAVPPVPEAVKCVNVTDNSLSFSWDAADGADSYVCKLLEGMTLVANLTVDGTTAEFSELKPSTTYGFAVKSSGKGGMSAYSSTLEAKTSASGSEGPDVDPDPVVPEPDPITDVYSAMMIPAAEETDALVRAFPGAEGGAMFITGGRGGKVLHVTTLEDGSGEGTLRWAVSQKYARTIVFDVAGTITLKSPLEIKYGDLTVAGQTAPGDGICIKGRYTRISASNVIIRFIRFRLGDEDSGASDSDDAIWGRYCKDILIDHCSMSWCIDECASFYANSNFTMQWCIISESMRSSVHSKGDHGYGGIWGGSNASFHHNLLAHHDSRNPRFDHPHIYEDHNTVPNRGVIDYRNNVVYDWGSNSSYGGEGYGSGKGTGINMVGNCYKPGPSSTPRNYFMDAYAVYAKCDACGTNINEGYSLLYMKDNLHTQGTEISADNASGIYWHNGEGYTNYGVTSPSQFAVTGSDGTVCSVTTHPSSSVLEKVCAGAGASLRRDKVDARVATDALKGTGTIIDCVTPREGKVSVSGLYGYTWPNLGASEEEKAIASTDSDSDGIPDYYETLFGLDPKNPSDGQAVSIDKAGRYTNFELYLHYLVRDIVSSGNEGGNYTRIQ